MNFKKFRPNSVSDRHGSRCGSSIRIRTTTCADPRHRLQSLATLRRRSRVRIRCISLRTWRLTTEGWIEKKKSWARERWSFPWGYEKNHCLSWWSSFPPHKLVKILADLKYGNLFKNFQYLQIFSITRKIENSEDYVSQDLVICTAEVGTFASFSFLIITRQCKGGHFCLFFFPYNN